MRVKNRMPKGWLATILLTVLIVLLFFIMLICIPLQLLAVLPPLVTAYFWGSLGGIVGGILAWGMLVGGLLLEEGFSFFLQQERGSGFFSLVFLTALGYLLGQICTWQKEHAKLLQRLRASYAATKNLHEASSLQEALGRFTEIVVRDLGFGNAAVLFKNNDNSLTMEAQHGFNLAERGIILPPGRGISSRALSLGRVVVVGDVSKDPDYIPGLPGSRSQVSLPLESGHEIVGVLTVESTDTDAFSPEDIEILEAVAEQASVAIEKTRLLEDTQQLLDETMKLALQDGLTGLYNHRFFKQQLQEGVARARRGKTTMALVLLDIDDFKEINDTYGHPVGDRVLQEFARLLERVVREGDTLARYGGEEFAVILPGSDEEGTRAFCHRLARTICDNVILVEKSVAVNLTVSIGAAIYPADADNWNGLINAADKALYRAKQEGKDNIRFAAG